MREYCNRKLFNVKSSSPGYLGRSPKCVRFIRNLPQVCACTHTHHKNIRPLCVMRRYSSRSDVEQGCLNSSTSLISCTLHFGFNYEINYQLDAVEYLFALSSFSSTCFGVTRPSSGAIGVTFLTNVAYGFLGFCLVRCWS